MTFSRSCSALLLCLGLAASVQARPQVLSLNLCYDDLLIAQVPDQISALTRYSDDSRFTRHQGTIESILQLAPDVVLANAYNDPLLVKALRAQGVQVRILPEPQSLAEVNAFWQEFAQAVDIDATAVEADIQASLQPLPALRGKRVLGLQANHYSFGENTLWHELLIRLGAENLAARQGSGLVTVLPEQVLRWQPDIIFVQVSNHFALAHRNQLHGALAPLLEERAVALPGDLTSCLAQQLPAFVDALQEALP
ncbi:ABC transporter substrate-binding protein [Aliidiomarina sp. Khilg15.8]